MGVVQTSMFDDWGAAECVKTPERPRPLARKCDPVTSQVAAEEVRPMLSGKRAEFVRRLAVLGEATAQEVADGQESIRKRAGELVLPGHIEAVGERTCKVTGSRATVYRCTDASN